MATKTALVSGSTSGIGYGVACHLLSLGYNVWITGRSEEKLVTVQNQLEKEFDGRFFLFQGDLSQTKTIESLLERITNESGRLDVAVANIGSGSYKRTIDISDQEWSECFDQNFFSTVRLCRGVISIMKKQNQGNIVCVSSIAGCEAIPAPVQYSTAKSALLSYVKNTSDMIADYGIRINAVSPGNIWFEDGSWDLKLKQNKKAVEDYINNVVPLKKFGTVKDVADAIAFLVSDQSTFITGTNLVVDGGQVRKII